MSTGKFAPFAMIVAATVTTVALGTAPPRSPIRLRR